ncbi:MAG TPA: YcnI family protein [Thermoleophilaceae bacterium]|nr:YcnI family protein [Thermoleophilaceae bacterium]
MSKRFALAAVAVGTLSVAAPASAHVTLQPKEVPAGGFARVNVRVPNERDNSDTTKVRVKFPPGFLAISYEPVEGWTVRVKKRRLDEPAELHGEEIAEEVDEVSFTASRDNGIGPGEFRDFGLSLRMPEDAGATLSFKALQTYGNGEVVRWIGPPDSEEPAAQVTLTASEEEGGDSPAAKTEPAAATADDDGPSTGLVIVALALGAAGLLTGAAGLRSARRAARG